MPATQTHPVEDSIAKIGDELAVGEDLDFQRKWWRFESVVWVLFVMIVILDVAGVFGRGPVAKAHSFSPNRMMEVNYERIERFSTPSILTLHFTPSAVQNGEIHLWVSDSVIKELGNQRIIPQPQTSTTGNGGIFYTFLATSKPNSIEFALQPSSPGISHFAVSIPGATPEAQPVDQFESSVVVMP